MEEELREALVGKSEKALHRFISLLFESMPVKSELSIELQTIKSDVHVLAETMQQSLKLMDEKFAAVDKRFDDMNRRFTYMFTFMTVGFTMITVLISLYQFLG